MKNYRGSRDANHAPVVDAFVALGCTVADMATCGVADFPDIAVGCAGVTYLVEIKNPETSYGRAGLNKGQAAFARDWRGSSVVVCYGPDMAADLVRFWRSQQAVRR